MSWRRRSGPRTLEADRMGGTERTRNVHRNCAPRGQAARPRTNRRDRPENWSANSQWNQPEPAICYVRCLAVSLVRRDADAVSSRQLLDRLIDARTCEQSINYGRGREQPCHTISLR